MNGDKELHKGKRGLRSSTVRQPSRVLGVDTSLRSTGFGIVETKGTKMSAGEYGVLKMPAKRLLSRCLGELSRGISEVIKTTQPEVVAIEGIFYCKNVKTAVILGEARGAVLAACAAADLPVYEYEPRRVKQAVVGFGSAGKDQVCRMVMSLLALREKPAEDASDALAIAICHLHNRSRHEALMPKGI